MPAHLALLTLPGHTSRKRALPTQRVATKNRGGQVTVSTKPYEEQVERYSIVSGTPKTVLPRIRHVLETLRPGTVIFWDGDGAMTHDDQMRSLRLMGEEVIPAVREMGKELGLFSSFEVDPATGVPIQANADQSPSLSAAASPAGNGFSSA